jgi:hypothetical protein
VVTNGTDTITLATHSGELWQPATPSERELNLLLKAAGRVAAADMNRAVEVLLGPESTVWVSAIRAATESILADLTGDWRDIERPFVTDFLIPRRATKEALSEIRCSKRIVIVEGAPLAGKSSVLRELALIEGNSDDLAVLFVEADGSGGAGLIQTIAGILANALGWHVTVEETRAWLRTLSNQSGPVLVLAIDGIGAVRDEVRRDIDELSGDGYGPNLRLVLGMDDTVTPQLVKNETGRKATRIGRRASLVSIGTLDQREFNAAVDLLGKHRIRIMDGGRSAPEYRVPWIIRSLVAEVVGEPQYADASLVAGLPPLLGPDLLRQARERFPEDGDIRHGFAALAQAVLDDTADKRRSASTVLESMETFVVRRKTVRRSIDPAELSAMIGKGLVKLSANEDREPIIVSRLPELLASEIALLMAQKLADKLKVAGPKEAAEWLVRRCSSLPLGDIIGAQALLDGALTYGGFSLDFIGHMINAQPRAVKIKAGTRVEMRVPTVGRVELLFGENDTVFANIGNGAERIAFGKHEDWPKEMYADAESWMILSHLGGYQLAAQSPDGHMHGRLDPALLMEVGTCSIVLRRPVADESMNSVLTHDIEKHGSIVCHKAGIVEPITFSILKFLDGEGGRVDEWIDEAVERGSLPLLARIDIALRHISQSARTPRAGWAREILDRIIGPAFDRFPSLH